MCILAGSGYNKKRLSKKGSLFYAANFDIIEFELKFREK